MLFAFVRAGFAHIRANGTDHGGLAAAEAHQLCGSVADGRAFHIELDAPRHVRNIGRLRSCACAMIANGRALQAEIDAFLVFVVTGHMLAFWWIE
ncbi:hypothetical protein [Chitinophaga caseinilytica]|uniref:Uncharacterized protein n=1 Tax=Chitinophaga caseinilytica TaxID=2267521 RepID=A0ABZ2YZS5_9BACT